MWTGKTLKISKEIKAKPLYDDFITTHQATAWSESAAGKRTKTVFLIEMFLWKRVILYLLDLTQGTRLQRNIGCSLSKRCNMSSCGLNARVRQPPLFLCLQRLETSA